MFALFRSMKPSEDKPSVADVAEQNMEPVVDVAHRAYDHRVASFWPTNKQSATAQYDLSHCSVANGADRGCQKALLRP